MEKIREDHHVKEFLNSRQIRQSTKRQYILRITSYCKFTGKTPTQLIEEAEAEEDNHIRMKNRKIKKYFIGYVNYLIEQKKSPNFIKSSMTTIRSFYNEYEIELPRNRTKTNKKRKIVTTDDIVGKKHILKSLEHCNLKYKAIILLMSSSGMGRSEIVNLKYKDFLNAISEYYAPSDLFNIYEISENLQKNKQDIIGIWQIKRYKTDMPYITFSSPESMQVIIYYLLERFKKNKPVISVDDWLFESNGSQIKDSSFTDYFMRINDACDFGYIGSQRFFTSHKLRKYFASTLNKKNIPELTTHWLLGHSIDSITDAYFKLDVNALKEQYKSVVEDLSIENVVVREITTKEYDNLLEELKEEKKERETEAAKKHDQIRGMEEKVEWLTAMMKLMVEDPEMQEKYKDQIAKIMK